MNDPVRKASNSEIRAALARLAYEHDEVRIVDPDLTGWEWLVTTHRGVFAVAADRVKLVLRGWFFGICRHRDRLYAFENCGHREPGSNTGRLIRLDIIGGELTAPRVLATGLHNNGHQVSVIDGLLCLVDTGNQAIRRYTLDGELVDVKHPFPVAPLTDETGAYLHINTVAQVGDRIGLLLHNGKARPVKNSEIAWLDENWSVVERVFLPGHSCHDIVEDEQGRLWHSLSRDGDILRSDGMRIHVTDDKMTRGIALRPGVMAVGMSTFGPRHLRGTLNGDIVIFDRRDFRRLHEIEMPAAPADIIAI
ncbi:MAG: hypothetical protein E7773_08055 [Sphingomonas sp.]|uniref:hypothetical protein n=1 Tax=Sphingomonas sp. TaxID=28214 RepID=UPI001228B7F8|nr:hypothetical protein [Sphingomonas sp.]THD35893.1 MAG: hypothetical protein E7773_08055 [Sphingomonas sp.]